MNKRVKYYIVSLCIAMLLIFNIVAVFGSEHSGSISNNAIMEYSISADGITMKVSANLAGAALPENKLFINAGKKVKLSIPQKEGYTFKGWNYIAGGKVKKINALNNKTYDKIKNVTSQAVPVISADFIENTYKLLFKAVPPKKGVKVNITNKKALKLNKVKYENDIIAYPGEMVLSCDGYTLAGWTRDKAAVKNPLGNYKLEVSVNCLGGKTKKDKNVILYSVWKEGNRPTWGAKPIPTDSVKPTVEPAASPTAEPATSPTAEPAASPTAEPAASPTAEPAASPTAEPAASPTAEPAASPTAEPIASPTAEPAASPTAEPIASPTAEPTESIRPTSIPENVNSQVIYVAADGAENGDGSIGNPFGKISDAIEKVSSAGDTVIYLRDGSYKEQISIEGTDRRNAGYISIEAYPGENASVTLPDGKEGAVIEINKSSNIRIKNLDIGNITGECVYGILVYSDSHDIYIENNKIHNIVTNKPNGKGDEPSDGEANAILLLGEGTTDETAISDVHIINNVVSNNINGWSENISTSGNCKEIYVEGNTVSDCTNIGICFYGNAGYCKNSDLDHPRYCYASNNIVYNCVCDYAECAGIYNDGASYTEISNNEVYKCTYGIEVGSEEKPKTNAGTVKQVKVHDNYLHDNKLCGIIIGGYTEDKKTGVVTETFIVNNKLENNYNGSKADDTAEIIFQKCDGIEISGNYFKRQKKDAPFYSCWMNDGYAKNVILKDNTYYGMDEAEDVCFEIPSEGKNKEVEGIEKINKLPNVSGEAYNKI